ncbi:MAG: oxygen-dependent coproporphyrinogen oxidase [Chlamydiales bacterium]|nr:oxygen-dependent coproporphyrinogen oxidase [Chlamydiales bacterium]
MNRKTEIVHYLKALRETIIASFESHENGQRFERRAWEYQKGRGGGEIAELRGSVFERAAVNWSGIEGDNFPMNDGMGPFFATGISLITHMSNPHAPTVHMNLRYLETKEKFWFGGGYDLTPMGQPYEEDTRHFHSVAKSTLDPFGSEIYPEFSQNAATYFFVPHRNKERGVGGIFFDHFNRGDFDTDFLLWKSVGNTFLEAINPIYTRRTTQPFTPEEKAQQYKMRGHYVEFNLLYDRGTQFGFRSGGNPDAILCSLPPLASW